MKKFVKYYLKYVILTAVFAAVLIAIGVVNINKIVDVEGQKSSYTRTQFDYFISSPDKNQVAEIEESQAVDKVFPYYALNNAFTGSSAAKEIFLLISDDMDDYSVSLLTKKTCVAGSFDENGAMLDNYAADVLGVKVGDSVTFNILGKKVNKTVSAIYLTSTYGVLTKGIVLVNFSDEIKEVYKPRAYSAAFIKANDVESVKTLLKDYVGEGNVALSFEEYVAINCGTKPPYQSQEDYDAECQAKYETYRTGILQSALTGGAQVAAKADSYALLQDRIETTENRIHSSTLLTSIAAAIVFVIVDVIFTVTNRNNDRIRCDDGKPFLGMFGGYVLIAVISAVIIAVLTFGILYAVASHSFFADTCLKTVLYFSLSTVVACPIVILAAFIYVRILYSSSAKL